MKKKNIGNSTYILLLSTILCVISREYDTYRGLLCTKTNVLYQVGFDFSAARSGQTNTTRPRIWVNGVFIQ